MTAPTISDARAIGRKSATAKVVIITLDQRLTYSITTWGDTIANCRTMARWAEGEQATQTLEAMANTLPTAGVIDVALDPNAAHDARRDLLTDIRRIVTGCGQEQGYAATAIAEIKRAMNAADDHFPDVGKKVMK